MEINGTMMIFASVKVSRRLDTVRKTMLENKNKKLTNVFYFLNRVGPTGAGESDQREPGVADRRRCRGYTANDSLS